MQTPGEVQFILRRTAIAGAIILLLLSSVPSVNARTRRHRKPNPVTVVLQPFLLARTILHTAADPLISRAPRAIASLATTPLHVARRADKILHVESADDDESVRVAYLVSRGQQGAPPDLDQAGDEDDNSEIERAPVKFSEGPTVDGSRALLRRGLAYAPSGAPQSVKNAIWAANSLTRKPYIWGGGHGSFYDRGYDCSGTVSFALRGAGAIAAPLPSSDFMRYGEGGRGRWLTIYARPGHTFAVIAGLRLDTTDFQNGGNTGPRWHADLRDTHGHVARHPAGM